jgi:hypothetical protein
VLLYAAFITNLKNKNMNAKEKASELIVNYQLKCKSLDYQQAKKCALIAVEEILNHHSQEQGLYRIDIYYWQQVKSELQSF